MGSLPSLLRLCGGWIRIPLHYQRPWGDCRLGIKGETVVCPHASGVVPPPSWRCTCCIAGLGWWACLLVGAFPGHCALGWPLQARGLLPD